MRWGGVDRDAESSSGGVTNQHFRLMRVERRTVHGPVGAIVVGKTLVSTEPGAICVDSFHLVEEVAGKAAVLSEEVVPIAAVVATGTKIGGYPQNLVDITDGRGDLVNEPLVFK